MKFTCTNQNVNKKLTYEKNLLDLLILNEPDPGV